EKLSTDYTSLNENEDRVAIVVEVEVTKDGELGEAKILQALVKNYAKLTYNTIGRWLEEDIPTTHKVIKVKGLEESLKIQHESAFRLRQRRHEMGALTLRSREVEAKVIGEDEITLKVTRDNLAHHIIEEFMIAANTVIAQTFKKLKIP